MKILKKLVLFSLCLVMLAGTAVTPLSVFADEAADEAYKQSLRDKGFPEGYLNSLLALHKKYSGWEFEPLQITEISRQQGKQEAYTWDYVIYQEYDAEVKRNLCSRSSTAYRDFANTMLYDSGWYKASKTAVEYEMDPRNFLGEKSIFRFLELSWADGISLQAVEAAIKGTFMENTKLDGQYSNTTYAEYFYNTGKEIGVNPVFLASRVRQEQGTGKSPLIMGTCGDRMWYYYDNGSGKYSHTDENGNLINAPTSGFTLADSKKYNGYYNYYNMGSAGTGYFYIFQGGMTEAIEGTPSMAAKWGGSPSWNTRWKALYGGSLKVKEKYISVYQNIPYLQKFNVDARSKKNFWGQYMQNITAATSEGNTMYNAYAANGFLDTSINFLIPVYEGMPEKNCKAPDGSEFVSHSLLEDKSVASYTMFDLSRISRDDGFSKKDDEMGIQWRVAAVKPSNVVELGKINLSKYDYVYIDYSTKGDFLAKTDGKSAVIGLSTDPNKDYSQGNEADFDIDCATLKSGNGDNLFRRTVKLNLKSSHVGDVYLSTYMPGGDTVYIHNIAFVTNVGHTGTVEDDLPDIAETEAPETELSADDSAADANAQTQPTPDANGKSNKKNSNTVLWIIVAIVAVAAIGVNVVLIMLPKKKKEEIKEETKEEVKEEVKEEDEE